MGYKKLSKLVAQLLGIIKAGELNQLTPKDKHKLLNDIEKELL